MTTVAEQLVEALIAAGVERVYGIVGDSLNGIVDAIRRSGRIEWIGVRNEEAAAFAACAEAQLTGRLAVCAGSCGPGHVHLVNGLYDAHRTAVPVLAIAAHIPSGEIGSGYFQETHPERLFVDCSHWCELVSSPSQMPRAARIAIQHAQGLRGVAVLALSGNVALEQAPEKPLAILASPRPVIRPSDDELNRLAALIDGADAVTMFCGAGCAGAKPQLLSLADRIAAPIVHTLRGKEWIEAENPFDVGMTGLIGFASGYHAMERADLILMLGADFPYQQFFPEGVAVAQIDLAPAHLGRRCPLTLGVVGDVAATIDALLPRLRRRESGEHLERALVDYARTRADLDEHARGCAGRTPIHPEYLTAEVSAAAADDAVFTADVGEPVVWAARYLRMRPGQRLIGSFTHGSMAAAMPLAIGAQFAFPGRQVVALAGDGGFAMLMGEWLTLLQHRLPVKMIVYNNSSLGFIEVEMKTAGFLDHGTGLTNPDFAAMAEATGALGIRVEDPANVRDALERAFAHPGPALVDVVTDRFELPMPPKTTFEQAKGFGIYALKAVLSGRGRDLVELARTNRSEHRG